MSQLLVTLWVVTGQAPLSMGFSRQESWTGLPFPPPVDLPHPGFEPSSPALQADSLPLSHQGSPQRKISNYNHSTDRARGQSFLLLILKYKIDISTYISCFSMLSTSFSTAGVTQVFPGALSSCILPECHFLPALHSFSLSYMLSKMHSEKQKYE